MRITSLALPTVIAVALTGCKAAPTECGPEQCAAVCDQLAAAAPKGDAGVTLNAFEAGILAETLSDMRQGVRRFDEHGVGICKGSGKDCEEYVGMDVGELPEGEYMVRAELAVPNAGERGTWKVTFATHCETTFTNDKGDVTTTQSDRSRDYDVSFAGKSRGYRISPLLKIKSPSEAGKEACTFTLTSPVGDKVNELKGSWTVPQG